TYKKEGGEVLGPGLKNMKVDGATVRLYFDHVAAGLTDSGRGLQCFELAGEDRVFHPADARIVAKDQIVVTCRQVVKPVSVRYAFKEWVGCYLYNTAGLPGSSFRTDNW